MASTTTITAQDIKAGIKFRVAGSPVTLNTTLVTGEMVFYRDGTFRASRHFTKHAFAQNVRRGELEIVSE